MITHNLQADVQQRAIIPAAGCTKKITSLTINKHRHKTAARMVQPDAMVTDIYRLGASNKRLLLTKDASLQLNTFWSIHTNPCLHSCQCVLHCNSGHVPPPQSKLSSSSWGSSIYCLSGSSGSHLFSHPSSSTYNLHRLLYFGVCPDVSLCNWYTSGRVLTNSDAVAAPNA
jgi:hypothetical protein